MPLKNKRLSADRTIILARFSALGDVAMTIPVVYSACRCYPDVNFVFVTRPSMVSMFVGAPANLTVTGVDVKSEYAGIGGLRRLAGMLRKEYRPDAFGDLHNVLRTKIIGLFMRMAGIPVARMFKPRAKRRALTRPVNKVMLPLTSQRARYREVFYKLGLPLNERFDGLYGGPGKADTAAFAAITTPKSDGERWIGIAPFAAHAGKIYPPEKMEQVLGRLQADADSGECPLRVFLFGGGEKETEILERWAGKYKCAVSLAGKKYGFGAELALMNHLDCMVSMDSANMHLAAIAGTPTLSVWGATHPYCGFKAWRQADDMMVQLPLSCRPCSVFGDKACPRGDYLCLNAIRPDMVYEKICKTIRNGK